MQAMNLTELPEWGAFVERHKHRGGLGLGQQGECADCELVKAVQALDTTERPADAPHSPLERIVVHAARLVAGQSPGAPDDGARTLVPEAEVHHLGQALDEYRHADLELWPEDGGWTL